jgi:hypothetical protein
MMQMKMAGAVLKIKATINIGKISSFEHKNFFPLWREGSSK